MFKKKTQIDKFKKAVEDFDNKIANIVIGGTSYTSIPLGKKFPYLIPEMLSDIRKRLDENITLLDLKMIMLDVNRITLEAIRLLKEEELNAKKDNHN